MAGPAERRDHVRALDRVVIVALLARRVRADGRQRGPAGGARAPGRDRNHAAGGGAADLRARPLVLEGVMQGGAGAIVAIVVARRAVRPARARGTGPRSPRPSAWERLHFCRLSCGWSCCSGGCCSDPWGLIVARAVRYRGPETRPEWSPLTHHGGTFTIDLSQNMNQARSRMARIVSSGRLLSAHVSVPADFYRQELKHRECLARQREYFSEGPSAMPTRRWRGC